MEKVIGKFWAKPAEQRIGPSKIGAIPDVCANISVGICRVLKARHGVKLDRGVVRVVGPNTEQGCRDIDAAVEKLIGLLDDGLYDGPERIEASRVLAGDSIQKRHTFRIFRYAVTRCPVFSWPISQRRSSCCR